MSDVNEMDLLTQALSGLRGADQQRIAKTGIDFIETLLRKNSDYGGSAWQVPTLAPSLDVGTAILVRMSDKVSRINSLAKRPAMVAESLEDTIKDLGAYALLWLARPVEEVCEKKT